VLLVLTARPELVRLTILGQREVIMLVAALTLLLAGPATLETLSWMAGSWEGKDAEGLEMEEVWLAPKGGTMLGLHRDVARGRTVSFEFLRIAVEADGIVYWASPKGRPATPFKLIDTGPRRAVFANPSHDFPKRILYWIDDTGSLHARIEGEGVGSAMEWTWRPLRR
jgi:hypothetical protein